MSTVSSTIGNFTNAFAAAPGSTTASTSSAGVPVQGLGSISSSTGLISGIPIQQTVSALVALDAGPRNQLQSTDTTLQNQQTALTQIQALLESLESVTNGLASSSLYTNQSLTSSNPSTLTATSTGAVAPGTYTYTPLRQATAQQYTSSSFASVNQTVGAGSVTIQHGGFINNGVSLDLLNGGEGFTPGQIQITDRSGNSATIDLSQARTVDDVINDINSNTSIHVTASADGNSFQLTDDTGQTVSNLKVSEVGGGTTAASLGLANINAAANQATGSSVLGLFDNLPLSQLNQGIGVQFDDALPDLQVDFQDGTSTNVDFNQLPSTGTIPKGTTDAANGVNAGVTFTAVTGGAAYDGVAVVFQNNSSITPGDETVNYDSTNKILTFNINAGQTTANDIVNAVKNNSTVSALFTASDAASGNGTGLINVADTAITAGPSSTGTTSALTANAKIQFTAVQPGPAYDGTSVQFVNNPSITAGNETVAYDATNKTLTFQIAAGSTTANDVINALNNDPTASAVFKATTAPGSNGTGLVSTGDTATTAGGAVVEPTSGTSETTLGDVLNTLNNVAPGKLKASISADGQSIQLTDLTTGSGTFSVSDINGSNAAQDLGLSVASSGGTITGNPVLGGLNGSLLRDLNGGQGLGQLGTIQLTDRSGNTATVDLSQAQTVDDVINDINNAGIGIQASVNQARNGITLTDTTHSTSGNLIVANGDSTNSADKLQITTNAAVSSVNSGSLNLQTVSENTTLASLNGGQGVAQGSLTITNSHGVTGKVTLGANQTTIGDVITSINALDLGVTASINQTGNGILLTDTSGGSGTLKVTDGNTSTAADLHLLTTATTPSPGVQTINGSTAVTISTTAAETVQDLIAAINGAGAGAQASLFSDGSTVTPYTLTIASQVPGSAGNLLIDTSNLSLNLTQSSSAGQDALLLVNAPGSNGVVVSSPTDNFTNVLAGATLTVNGNSTTPVSLTVASDTSQLEATFQSLVSDYNQALSTYQSDTAYSAVTNTGAVLEGNPNLVSVQSQLAGLITKVTSGFGGVQSLEDLGISVGQDGSLSFDSSQFQSLVASNPTDVQNFLSNTTNGVSVQFKNLIESVAGANNSLLSNQVSSLNSQITNNQAQITQDNSMLSSEQTRLLNEFYNQETILAQLQSAQQAVAGITDISPLTSLSSLAFNAQTE